MKKFLLASSMLLLAGPALAQDRGGYIGVSGGILSPKTNRADLLADFTTVQAPVAPVGPASALDTSFANSVRIDYKRGTDVDGVFGYDFGLLRTELEIGYKRAKLNDYSFASADLAAISAALNRPSAAPDPFAPGLPALTVDNSTGRITVLSGMLNALLDADLGGVAIYGGGGAGRARVKLLGNRDDVWAYQAIAGARVALSDNIDFGIKYRYFRTARLSLGDSETIAVQGNPDLLNLGTAASPVFVERRTSAALDTRFNDRFSSHSLLASLFFNFGLTSAPVPAAPPPPPPPVEILPAPATQTCPDGSVILAIDACPVPPSPPPPPVEPVRG